MSTNLPAILSTGTQVAAFDTSSIEASFIDRATQLFNAGFFEHSLLDLWNAAVANLRRRIEAYGIELFLSVIKEEPGRKRYQKDGESLSERWQGVDDLVLISGSSSLGLLNPKAAKSLEMINWMRNHASPAHSTDHAVEREDVVALALMLQRNLFEAPMPEVGHSVAGLFEPVKRTACTPEAIEIHRHTVLSLRPADVRVAFGFMIDLLSKGEEPSLANVRELLPSLWERATEELRATAGLKYHTLIVDPDSDQSADKAAASRLLDFLTEVGGVKYVPDATRTVLFRTAAKNLAAAKDTTYGWEREASAAKTLAQFGPFVPSTAFEDVYQEILAVWCGNYWGRSAAFITLKPFIDSLSSPQILRIGQMFQANVRVRSELFQPKPRAQAVSLLNKLREHLTIETHKADLTKAIESLP